MKIIAKTLKGEVINIEIEPEATVLQLKESIHKEKGLEVDSQKIVFKGKATNNTDVLSAIGVKENDFLVVMTLIKKPEVKKEEPKSEPKVEEGVKPAEKPVEKSENQVKEEKVEQVSPEQEVQINELMSMGFDREKCIAALRAAFNDTDRAVEYLLNGIPQGIAQGGQQGGSQGNGESQQIEVLFRNLINSNPAFLQIKQLIRNDPSKLEPILNQISMSSPELYALITQYPEEFQKIILEDGQGQGQGSSSSQPRPGSIQISPEDNAAIERLMALGFTKMDSAQVYFACDKNEELAANLLFDRMATGDLDPMEGNQNQGGNNQGGDNDDDDDNLFN